MTVTKKPRQMPKGGRKGGAMFPRMSLAEILPFAKKLVSKTHTAPQPEDVILMGVFGSKHEKGRYGMSAAKQYGLMTGDRKTNFAATDLAKKIAAAPDEERGALCRVAALKPTIFKALFDTYQGDVVPQPRLRQRAADLNVHPDETATCAELYVATLVAAGLASVEGDQVNHTPSSELSVAPARADAKDAKPFADDEANGNDEVDVSQGATHRPQTQEQAAAQNPVASGTPQVAPRAVFNVNVTLDSSLDIEKLQKQLELLRRYGAM